VAAGILPDVAGGVGILPGFVAEEDILAVEGIESIGWGMLEKFAYGVVSVRAGEVLGADAD